MKWLCVFLSLVSLGWAAEKPIVVVIPSYNNEKWVEKNFRSILEQNYTNFRIVYIDDASKDSTFAKVCALASKTHIPVKLVHNEDNQGALRNLYQEIHQCDDDEIIVTVDGDDWLAHKDVLLRINEVYSAEDIWMTYGSYQTTRGDRGIGRSVPQRVIERNSFRKYTQPSHLRTFYAWLFKKIAKEDLLYKGEFLPMTWDLAIMFPMMEMAGTRQKFIEEIVYIYNVHNPVSDDKKNFNLQRYLDKVIRRQPKYSPLTHD